MLASLNEAKSRLLEAAAFDEGLGVQGIVPVDGGLGNVPDAVASGSVPIQVEVPVDENDPAFVDVLVGGLRERDGKDVGVATMPSVEADPDQQLVSAGDDDFVFLDEFIDDMKTKDANDGARSSDLVSNE